MRRLTTHSKYSQIINLLKQESQRFLCYALFLGQSYWLREVVQHSIAVIDATKFQTSDPNCPIQKFTFSETSSQTGGLSQNGCTLPDNSSNCRSIVVNTDSARVIGATTPEMKYQFTLQAEGGATLNVQGSIEVICSNQVIITKDSYYIMDFSFEQTFQSITSTIVIDDSMFSTDDVNCPIERYIFSETSVDGPGLSETGCSTPDISVNCRTMVVQSQQARKIGSSPSEMQYQYIIEAKQGAISTFRGIVQIIEIPCSPSVKIFENYPNSKKTFLYAQNSGLQKFEISSYQTNNPICDITSYRVTQSLPAVIQPGCQNQGDVSQACKTLFFDTSKIGKFEINFTIKSQGGAEKQSSKVIFDVIGLIEPNDLQNGSKLFILQDLDLITYEFEPFLLSDSSYVVTKYELQTKADQMQLSGWPKRAITLPNEIQKSKFYLKVQIQEEIEILSHVQELWVECGPNSTIISQSSQFVTKIQLIKQGAKRHEFKPFISSNPKCPIAKYELKQNITGASIEQDCEQSPCNTILFESKQLIKDKFSTQITVTAEGIATFDSSEIEFEFLDVKPYFLNSLKNIELQRGSKQKYNYTSPQLLDPFNELTDVIFTLKPDFQCKCFRVSFKEKKFEIYVDQEILKKEDIGQHKLIVQLLTKSQSQIDVKEENSMIINVLGEDNSQQSNKTKDKQIKILQNEKQSGKDKNKQYNFEGNLESNKQFEVSPQLQQKLEIYRQQVYDKHSNQTYNTQNKKASEIQPVLMKLGYFDSEGIATIDFNQKLKTYFNLTSDRRELQQQVIPNEFDMQQLGSQLFSFQLYRDNYDVSSEVKFITITNWTELKIDLKFNFKNPLAVSSGGTQDNLKIKLRPEFISFFNSADGTQILNETIEMNIDLPSQLPENFSLKYVKESAKQLNIFCLVIIIIQFCIQLAFKKGKEQMFSLMQVLQILDALRIYHFYQSAVMEIIFKELQSFMKLELMSPNFYLNKVQPGLSLVTLFSTPIQRFRHVNSDIIPGSAQGILLFAVIGFLLLIPYFVFRILLPQNIRNLIDKELIALKNQLIFNKILTFLMMQHVLQALICVRRMQDGQRYIPIIIYYYLITIPIAFGAFMFINYDKLDSKEFRKKFQSIYKGISIMGKDKWTVLYFPLFYIKRAIIILIPTLVGPNSGLQIFMLLLVIKFKIIFYGAIRAHDSQLRRINEYFNDSCLMTAVYSLICMTDFNENEISVFYNSFQFLGWLAFVAIVNILIQISIINEQRILRKVINLKKKHQLQVIKAQSNFRHKLSNGVLAKSEQTKQEFKKFTPQNSFESIPEEDEEQVENLPTINELDDDHSQKPEWQKQNLGNLLEAKIIFPRVNIIKPVIVDQKLKVSKSSLKIKTDSNQTNEINLLIQKHLESIESRDQTFVDQQKFMNSPTPRELIEDLRHLKNGDSSVLTQEQSLVELRLGKSVIHDMESVRNSGKPDTFQQVKDLLKEIKEPYVMVSDIFEYDENFRNQENFKVIKEPNGKIYRGLVNEQNLQSGYGILTYPENCVYEGWWLNGRRAGYGFFKDGKSGNNYKGCYVRDLPHGVGVEVNVNEGWQYEGTFNNGKFDLYGKWMGNEGLEEFVGFYKNGLKHGEGSYKNKVTGETYQGSYKNGVQNGKGIQQYPHSKLQYNGNFKNGLPHGKGVSLENLNQPSTCRTYEGFWCQGKYHGIGKLQEEGRKQCFIGKFFDGQKDGKGTEIVDAIKSKYFGDFLNGQKHGYGELTVDGKLAHKGFWENDNPQID